MMCNNKGKHNSISRKLPKKFYLKVVNYLKYLVNLELTNDSMLSLISARVRPT